MRTKENITLKTERLISLRKTAIDVIQKTQSLLLCVLFLHVVRKELVRRRISTPNTLYYFSQFYFLNVFIDDDKY